MAESTGDRANPATSPPENERMRFANVVRPLSVWNLTGGGGGAPSRRRRNNNAGGRGASSSSSIGTGRGIHASSHGDDRTTTRSILHERLREVVVFVLHEDGRTSEYRTMILRELYHYVMKAITCRPLGSFYHASALTADAMSSAKNLFASNISSTREGNISSNQGVDNSSGDLGSAGDSASQQTGATGPSSEGGRQHASPTVGGSNVSPPLPLPSLSLSSGFDNRPVAPPRRQRAVSVDNTAGSAQQQQHKVSFKTNVQVCGEDDAGNKFTLPSSVTQRERLGGYLHPRDMRRLVTPFSSTNQPELMVRRHVMLLNFDPLRAIVLRDRLLVLVPDGADSILIKIEKMLRGGLVELENEVFGEPSDDATSAMKQPKFVGQFMPILRRGSTDDVPSAKKEGGSGDNSPRSDKSSDDARTDKTDEEEEQDDSGDDFVPDLEGENDEWDDIDNRKYLEMPFELRAVDAILGTVVGLLLDDASSLSDKVNTVMSILRGERGRSKTRSSGEQSQERLRVFKDKVNEMEARVRGFGQALTEVLDEDEDMALMNLSRLVTHPERFIMPVSADILSEESDQPELILEAYLQQALSAMNHLDLLMKQIESTEGLVSMKLDTVRNRLLYISTVLNIGTLCLAVGSLIGSIFGMNLTNHMEVDPVTFMQVVVGTLVGSVILFLLLVLVFWRASIW